MDGPGAWPIGGSRHALAYRSLDRDDSLSETVSLQRTRKRRQQARCPILRSSYFSVKHKLTESSKKVTPHDTNSIIVHCKKFPERQNGRASCRERVCQYV